MEMIKISMLALCAVSLILLVKNYRPEFGLFTVIASSIVLLYFLLDSLRYGFSYVTQIYQELNHGKAYFPIILKVLAIAYITEFTSQLCKDAGESAIASKVELAGKIIIFCVAIPVFTAIFDLIEELL